MKSFVQQLLRRYGLYHRLKASALYEMYWRIADPELVRKSSAELTFYRTVLHGLRHKDLIFDVGANHGSKTRMFLRMGARVVAVDPDPANQDILRESFLKLRLGPSPVTLVPLAVSDKTGTETLWVEEPGSTMNTLSRKWVDILRNDDERFGQPLGFGGHTTVETTTLDALIDDYGVPFFVKIDVEGAEPQVLRGLTRAVPYVSFEVNLPEFLAEGLECVDCLEQLSPQGVFSYVISYEDGFELPTWVSAPEFSRILQSCQARSVEVFWRSVNADTSAASGTSPQHVTGAEFR